MMFTEIEHEIILLKTINGAIDSMVNHSIFELRGADPSTELWFHTATHQKFFNIMLVDYLSGPDEMLAQTKGSFLSQLLEICDKPQFNVNGSVAQLRDSSMALKSWLDTEVMIKTWLPSIEKNLDLKILRSDFLRISGNISKHSPSRLTRTSKELASILRRNGVVVDEQDSLLILDDFYQRFHSDILNYHGTTLCEMLNNIRWGIHEYLLPQYNLSMKRDTNDPIKYEYIIPDGINSKLGRTYYWDLMNEVRGAPYVRTFVGTKWLKLRY